MNRTVVVLADDLFWKTKIEQAAKSAQAPIVFLSDPADLAKAVEPSRASVVLIDLSLRKEPAPARRPRFLRKVKRREPLPTRRS